MGRRKRAGAKKKVESPQPEARRQKRECSRFLMPDAPRKRSRITSPERVECPLKEGTPSVPPLRIPRPWEEQPMSSTERPPSPVSASSIPSQVPTISFLTGIRQVSNVEAQNLTVMAADIELIGFSLESSIVNSPQSSMVNSPQSSTNHPLSQSPSLHRSASPNLLDDDDFNQWAQQTDGSDEDVGDENVVTDRVEFLQEIGEENYILELDAAEDETLRNVASSSGQPDLTCFNWVEDVSTFTGTKETFIGTSGPTFPVKGETPLSILQMIFDVEIMSLIVEQTNKYARQMLSQLTPHSKSRMERWKDTDIDEMWVFFAILMIQSLVPLPVESEYWYSKLDFLKMPHFGKTMSYARFIIIKKCLHFVDNTQVAGTSNEDKRLSKIKPLVDLLRQKFSSMYLPSQDIALDESLLLWKGRLSFAQRIANKRAKAGIKSYELCESKTGYLWDLQIYAGKGNDMKSCSEPRNEPQNEPEDEPQNVPQEKPQGATSKIVFDLVRPLLGRGHVLVMDNFYNAPLLSRLLKRQKTDTMGTLRLNREYIPASLKMSKSEMRPGEVAYSQTTDLTILVWRDVNIVSMISTYHKVEVAGKEKFGRYKYKPQVILDYNLAMGGVDKKDQLLSAFPMERCRNRVWYKKLFRRLLNVSIMNACIIFCHQNETMRPRLFRQTLIQEILSQHKSGWGPTSNVTIVVQSAKRSLLQGGHYPEKSGSCAHRCKWCSMHGRSARTSWRCDVCKVPLCTEHCFKNYHTKPN